MGSNISREQMVAETLMGRPKFVSYDGKYPDLCSGTLKVRIGSKVWSIHRLTSGGSTYIDSHSDEQVDEGPWSIDEWPEGFPESQKEAVIELVNEKVDHGCCGGCI